ncbi:MAG TPA: hypothetical protein VFZ53_05055 [Polyangiaceae bacterium]
MRASSSSLGNPFVPIASVLIAFSSLACSGESQGDGGEGDDDSGGSSTGGTGTGGTAGSGTGGTSGSDGTPAYCDAAFMPTDPTAVIDDIEDGNSLIAVVSDRNGSWWITSDGTAEGTISPMSGAAPPPERILGKRCESEYGIRVTGQGFTQWGANVSIGFRYEGMEMPIDASDFSGVMFWARVGETHNSPVRVQFQDTNTYPNGGMCNPDPASGTEQCYDGWGTALLPLDSEWRLYKIPFSRVAQQTFGYAGEALDTTGLYTLEWIVQQNSVFDLWLDDVWFYE